MRYLTFVLVALLTWSGLSVSAQDAVTIKESQIPLLLEREDNVLFYLRLDATSSKSLNEVTLQFDKGTDLKAIKAVKLYYAGTEARQDIARNRMAPVQYISSFANNLKANPSYSMLLDSQSVKGSKMTFKVDKDLFPGVNFFWVSIQMSSKATLATTFKCDVEKVTLDGKVAELVKKSPDAIVHRTAFGVRKAGDDGSAAFRIPGLVTSNKGTLLGVYDVRYNSSVDLQEYVDVGLSRSTDGGKTWEKMRLPLSFGEFGGMPRSQNGVGDPAILVDTETNTIWVIAAWTHGMGNQRAWHSSMPGMDLNHTAQLVLTKSEDDGKTWSEPINITDQVKDPSWYFLLQGPGRGISMKDGTLVFPIQYIESNRIPSAGVMYSKDKGATWHIHKAARTNTTESQVVEVEPGVLMLNMRDNRGGSRAVYTTTDLGKTWKEHESSRTALREPVCMASIIAVDAKDNSLNRDILLFSNPNTTQGRNFITIKMSLDGGNTWKEEHQVMLDEDHGWGYSCLSMVDKETVAILYESSVAHMTFQIVKLSELMK